MSTFTPGVVGGTAVLTVFASCRVKLGVHALHGKAHCINGLVSDSLGIKVPLL